MHPLPGGSEIKYHSRKTQTCLNATGLNAVTPDVCDLFLLSPLKSASAAATLDQHAACSQQTSSTLSSFFHSHLHLLFHPSPTTTHPLSSLIPFPCNAYSLIASVLVTTLLHSLVQTATCETDKHPIFPYPRLYSINWTSSGYLSPGLVLLC